MQSTISRMKADKVKPRKYRRSVFRFVPIVMTPFMLVACGAFRIHDQGRSDVAKQAVEISEKLSSGGTSVFVPMEQNFDSMLNTEEKLSGLANKDAYESLKRIIAAMSADGIAKKIVETMNDRLIIIEEIEENGSGTVKSINEELDRQAYLTNILNEKGTSTDKFDATLKRVEKRLELVENIVTNASKLGDSLKKGSKDGKNEKPSLSDSLLTKLANDNNNNTAENKSESEKKDTGKTIQDILSKAKDSIKKVENDERVDAATKLLQQVGIATASIEQTRLGEMKRHLGEIQRIKELIDVHDTLSMRTLFLPAIGHLLPVLNSKANKEVNEKDDEKKVYTNLVKKEVVPLLEKLKEITRYDLKDFDFNGKKDPNEYCIACWKDNTLKSYVATDLKVANVIEGDGKVEELEDETLKKAVELKREDNKKAQYIGKSPELIASFAILVYYEGEYFKNAQLLLDREDHRYSIRLSKINAQQRADIVNQLTQGLDIYYKGGIKPEDVAEIALLASQVGSLTFIGTQVH